ncbi:MAG: 2-amino-4-hydroxy-6-hydroxymethyldihydropteridine diphosphokinase [Rubricoccaceae bacterium]
MAQPEFTDAYIGLGSNVGDRLGALQKAVRTMASWPGTNVVAASSIYETEAHVRPGTDRQPDHLNAVVHLKTGLAPLELLNRLHEAERAAGRDPNAPPWSPRPLDLDLLMFGVECVDTDELVIPHPRIAERRFVLQPLADVAPSLLIGEKTVAELLTETSDTARIVRTDLVLVAPDLHGP